MPKNKAGGRRRKETPPRIVLVGDDSCGSVLGKQAKPVQRKSDWAKLPKLVKTLLCVLRKAGGQGISAPQTGSRLSVVVIETRKTVSRRNVAPSRPIVMVNPVITDRSGKMVMGEEGCLSVIDPDGTHVLRGKVERHQWIKVTYLDLKRRQHHNRTFRGFKARVVQHEIDHLAGKLFLDRVDWRHNAAKQLRMVKLKKKTK